MQYFVYTLLCLLITLLLPRIVLSSSSLCVDFIQTQTMLFDLIAQKKLIYIFSWTRVSTWMLAPRLSYTGKQDGHVAPSLLQKLVFLVVSLP